MTPPRLDLVIPGPLDQRTGGYIYDARMVDGLRGLGWLVKIHSVTGVFPDGDAVARDSLSATLAGCSPNTRVIIDGLAMGALPGPLETYQERLRLVSLLHHPLADETGLDPETRDRFVRLERRALAACEGVVVTSAYTARRLDAYGVDPTRVRVVRPGTDPAPLAPGVSTPVPTLLCVGALTPRKGQDLLVTALADLDDLPWHCICVGSLERAPRYAADVQRLARARGLGSRIVFAGECDTDTLGRFYREASLFVLPSHYEGYGMVLTEALARGLPVVSTTGGAIPDTVPAAASVLVPPGDEMALADALRGVIAGSEGADCRERLGVAARQHARSLPDWSAASRGFADAVRELTPDGDV
ncbi:MAG: glycosyltransferase family 4 protein [Acidobacteriota bacterium]|nr:glycosyltransferase family 4 protein [Acidobacteriota bacterium]